MSDELTWTTEPTPAPVPAPTDAEAVLCTAFEGLQPKLKAAGCKDLNEGLAHIEREIDTRKNNPLGDYTLDELRALALYMRDQMPANAAVPSSTGSIPPVVQPVAPIEETRQQSAVREERTAPKADNGKWLREKKHVVGCLIGIAVGLVLFWVFGGHIVHPIMGDNVQPGSETVFWTKALVFFTFTIAGGWIGYKIGNRNREGRSNNHSTS